MFKKIFIFIIGFLLLLPTILLTGCFNVNNSRLISLDMNTSTLVETKTTYHVGDSFSPSKTYVNLCYYDKQKNEKWTLKDYNLTQLSSKIDDIEYTISGFETSVPVNSLKITITISSTTYENTLSTSFYIDVLPEYVVSAEVVNSSSYLKQCFILNESLNFQNFKIQNTYSNGRVDMVNVTSNMITGFDTSSASISKKTMTITQNNFTINHDYYVVPSSNYTVFEEPFVTCFVPSNSSGFIENKPEENVTTYHNSSIARIQIGCYQKFTYTESGIISLYNTSTTIVPNVSVISYKTQNINNITATICSFKYKNYPTVYTGIYFDTYLSISVGSGISVQQVTVEILFTNYASSNVSSEVFNTLLNSITK